MTVIGERGGVAVSVAVERLIPESITRGNSTSSSFNLELIHLYFWYLFLPFAGGRDVKKLDECAFAVRILCLDKILV